MKFWTKFMDYKNMRLQMYPAKSQAMLLTMCAN